MDGCTCIDRKRGGGRQKRETDIDINVPFQLKHVLSGNEISRLIAVFDYKPNVRFN